MTEGVTEPVALTAPAPASRTRWPIIVGAVVVGAVVLAGAAVAAFVLLSGRGPQPEAAMPADTIAFVKLDLDPSAGQKVNALRFLRDNLPSDMGFSVDPDSADPIGDALTSSGAFDGAEFTWQDIDSWAGDRAAVAAVPTSSGDVAPVFIVRVDDETAMTSFFTSYAPDAAYAMVREGYAVIAESQEQVDAVTGAKSWLADSASFQADMSQLGGGQIVVGWADVAASQAAQQSIDELAGTDLPSTEDFSLTGRVAMGLAVEPDVLELLTVASDFAVNGDTPPWMSPSADLGSLPADVVAAVTDLAEQVDAETGLGVDDVIRVLSSTMTAFAVEGSGGFENPPLIGVRLAQTDTTTPSDVGSLLEAGGMVDAVRVADGAGADGTSYVELSSSDQDDPFARAGGGTLSDLPSFDKVIVDDAAIAAFVNMSSVWKYFEAQSPDMETYPDITAAGLAYEMGAEGDNISRMRLRVAFDGQ
ncbi:MAG: hypothetical protein NTX29_11235 [Actinobacteria bacterium]|nr:hypothetical protein [Actinomycetota bacterium]